MIIAVVQSRKLSLRFRVWTFDRKHLIRQGQSVSLRFYSITLVGYRIFFACLDLDTFAIDTTSRSFVKGHEHVTSRGTRGLTDMWHHWASRISRVQLNASLPKAIHICTYKHNGHGSKTR